QARKAAHPCRRRELVMLIKLHRDFFAPEPVPSAVSLQWFVAFMSVSPTPPPGRRTSGGLGNLDQVLIRIADVDRTQRKARAGALYRPELDRNIRLAQLRDYLIQRPVGEETDVQRSRRRIRGIAVGYRALVVQVDLLLAETQRLA